MAIAFQGERGAFTELAAIQYFGARKKTMPVGQWEHVFEVVEKRAARYGIIPIENSLGGSIHRNYDLLLHHDLRITGEIYLKISQFLLANKGVGIRQVARVFSHPQGFEQCKLFFKKMPGVECVPVSNTAAAAKKNQGRRPSQRRRRLLDAGGHRLRFEGPRAGHRRRQGKHHEVSYFVKHRARGPRRAGNEDLGGFRA